MKPSPLHRKLLRELWQQRGPLFAICLVIGSGIATWIMNRTVLDSLRRARERYYEEFRFADLYVSLVRAPEQVAAELAAVPGVREVESRIVANVILDLEDVPEVVTGRVVSLPESGDPLLNELHLDGGRLPEPGREEEVVISSGFAEENSLALGSTLRALLHGRHRELRIVGIGMSPEFVYTIPPGNLVPDNRLYGVLWMRRPALEHAFDLDGAFNDVVARADRGANEPEILREFDRILAPWGGLGAYGAADQFSNWYLESEFSQLERMGAIVPLIFHGVAAFLLGVFLRRLLQQQREAIAVLKAFGYSNIQVGIHFLELVVVVVVLASSFGALAGNAMGSKMIDLYRQYFVFPELDHVLDPAHLRDAVLVALVAAFIGTVRAVGQAVTIPPAEAMRPPAPASFRRAFWERFGWGRRLPVTARMVVRSVMRQPVKSALSVFAVACGVALLVTGNSLMDSMDFGISVQFQQVQREDGTLSLVEPRARGRMVPAVAHLPGVRSVELHRLVSVRFRAGHRDRRSSLEGVERGRELVQLLDAELRPVEVPEHGLLLSAKLAEVLGVRVGDRLTMEVLEGARPVREVPVAAVYESYFGMSAYMELGELCRLLGEGSAANGARIALDPLAEPSLHARLKATPAVAALGLRRDMLRSFEETAKESFAIMSFFTYSFALVIALGVVYNNARIILSERARELASLRVLGYRRREISAILLGEIGLLTVLALPVGLALGVGLATILLGSMDSELYRLPIVIENRTFATAILTILAGSAVAGLWVRRHLDRLDLVSALKSRE